LASNNYANADYPAQNIDPRQKGYEWVLQYIKAAYRDSRGYMPLGTIQTGNIKMDEIKMYTLGKQSVNKYKKQFSPGNPEDPSWRSVDWNPIALLPKFRNIALAKLHQKKFDITAFPVDPIAVSEEDAFFNEMKVKILMREEARKMGSDLLNSPVLQPQPGEPEDLEQLQIAKDYNYKHQMAIEGENAINLVFQQNHVDDELRKRIDASLYDWGIAGLTQYLDENGMVKLRDINMEYFGSSYFEKPDGSDMVHWFEIVPTFIADLAPYYSKEQMDKICQQAAGKNGNPGVYYPVNGLFNTSWSRFKVMVLKIKFLSWNDYVYSEEYDSRGNVRFGKTSYNNKQFIVNNSGELAEIAEENKGAQTPKYIQNCKKVRYKGSWIVNTEFMHDWGEDLNQNRKLSSWWDTDLDIQIYAYEFFKMQFSGITEKLIPLEDRACMIWFNLQNLSNKLIPYLINLDMNAIEGAFPYGKGGTKGKPSDVVDFIFSNFVVPFRSNELLARNPNYKPVSIEATGQLAAFGQLYDELAQTIDLMRQVSGLNELTDGSTPNAKTLVPVAESAIQSTNNALYLISEAEKNILLRTADAVLQKVQIAVKLGKVEGYAKALGSSSVKFFQINPDIALHELGVYITDALTEEQKQMLWQDVNIKESQGLLDIADKQFLMNFRNTQQAVQLLSYKIQKRKEEAHAQQMELQQQQTEGNAYVAQASEMAKQQSIQLQLEADLIRIQAEKQWEYEIEIAKKQFDLQGEMYQADSRNTGNVIQSQAKIIGDRIAADAALEKQKIANKKPRPASSKK
jgi:hypothetical protein